MAQRNKLNLQQVVEILMEHQHLPSRKVAQKYNVSRCCVTNLRRGRSWKTELTMLQEVGHLPKSVWKPNAEPKKIYPPRVIKTHEANGANKIFRPDARIFEDLNPSWRETAPKG